jgi:hypothetical protein
VTLGPGAPSTEHRGLPIEHRASSIDQHHRPLELCQLEPRQARGRNSVPVLFVARPVLQLAIGTQLHGVRGNGGRKAPSHEDGSAASSRNVWCACRGCRGWKLCVVWAVC